MIQVKGILLSERPRVSLHMLLALANAPRFFSPGSSEAARVHTRPRTVDDLEENNSDASTDITTQTSERARRSVCAILSACASNMRDINWTFGWMVLLVTTTDSRYTRYN